MTFRMLGGQATSPGMSGGPALDAAGHLAGILYGRRRDRYNLLVPAAQVAEVWEVIKNDANSWMPFAPAVHRRDPLSRRRRSRGGRGSARLEHARRPPGPPGRRSGAGDRSLSGGHDNPAARRYGGAARLYLGADSLPNRRQDVRIWHDGEEIRWDRRRGTAGPDRREAGRVAPHHPQDERRRERLRAGRPASSQRRRPHLRPRRVADPIRHPYDRSP